MKRRGLALFVIAAAMVMAGCATLDRPAGEGDWISGRMSVRVAASAERSAQSVSADFELRAQAESGELRLNSPLGTRIATAFWSPGEARLVTPDGEARYDNLDELSRQSLGERLPLVALPDWLTGRPWPGAPHRINADGFEQLTWQVNLLRRGEGWIEARRDTPPEVLVRVRLDAAR